MENFKGISPHRPIIDGSEIRLVILQPGEFGEPIVCELEHITFTPEGDYEAVSYVWGDAAITKPITLDGCVYPVTNNLYTALQFFRRKDSSRRLWIDSLCINQTDKAERSREIQKMRDIYQCARHVLVWVGDYTPFTRGKVKLIFEFVEEIATAPYAEQQDVIARKLGYDTLWSKQQDLGEFLRTRVWFERMWVIQEVSVRPQPRWQTPEKGPMIHCGSLQLSFVYLWETLLWWVFRSEVTTQLRLPEAMVGVNRLINIWYKCDVAFKNPEANPPLGTQLSWHLATVAGEFRATDTRDICYALVGLLPVTLPAILIPDYFKSSAQVLTEYATYILESVGLIDIIQYSSGLSKELPSWVPDWKHSSPHAIGEKEERYPGAHIQVVGNGKGLELDLIKFTEVKKVGPILRKPTSTSNLIPHLANCFRTIEDIFMPVKADPKALREFRRRLYELLVRFDVHQRQSLDSTFHLVASRNFLYYLPGHDDYLQWSTPGSPCPTSELMKFSPIENYYAEHIWESVIDSVQDKQIFCCTDGSLGIMAQPHTVPLEGDIVCSFKGACGEFIVRPSDKGHRLIGRSERTTKGFDCNMEDVDVESWVDGRNNMGLLEAIWSTETMKRIVLW